MRFICQPSEAVRLKLPRQRQPVLPPDAGVSPVSADIEGGRMNPSQDVSKFWELGAPASRRHRCREDEPTAGRLEVPKLVEAPASHQHLLGRAGNA